MNIAVIGSGYWGKNLVRNFHELGVLHTVCDNNLAILRSFQEEYPGKKFQTSFDAVTKDPSVDAVVIATPAETHFELSKKALLAGKHVFVEKPLALLVHEAELLTRMAAQNDLKLMVGHILLYHPAIVKLKELIRSGELGKINYIYSNRLNLGKFRTEENILWSFAPHDISVIVSLLEEMPMEVAAQGGNYLNQDIADVTISMLSFKNGVRGHIFVSWLHPNREQRLVVVGDKKMAVFDDTLPDGKLQIHDKGVDWVNRQPVPRKNEAQIVPVETYEPLKAECAHFIECIQDNKPPVTDGINGIQVLRILDACQKSLEHRGSVIHLNGKKHHEDYVAHETAVIDPHCTIGEGTEIGDFSRILEGADIGKGCLIGQNVLISKGVRIGDNVRIDNNVTVCERVVMEEDVYCCPSVVFALSGSLRSHLARENDRNETRVKKGACISANATVLYGKTIGRYAIIGPGAVITDDVPDYALMLGNPAGIAGWVCACGNHLHFKDGATACRECGKAYAFQGDRKDMLVPFMGAPLEDGHGSSCTA